METLNTIEKITLLVSTSIVCLANLFVLIEKTKKSEKHTLNTIIQKLLGFKNTFFVFCLIVVMSSCSGGKFLNRKYTSGRFIENKKSLTHNTTYVDTTKIYSSLNTNIEFKKSSVSLNDISVKDIIDKKIESIIKKDSVFIKLKNGKDSIYGKKCDTSPVIVLLNGSNKIQKTIKGRQANKYKLSRIKNNSIVAICLSLIPIIGFIVSATNRNRINKYQKLFPNNDLKKYKRFTNIALIISTILLLALIALIAYQISIFSLTISIGAIAW